MSAKKRKLSEENRTFKEKWELDYFISIKNNKIQCLICMQVLSVSKEYNVKRHYTSLHEEKYKKHVGEARKVMVTEYKKKLIQQTSMFSKVSTENEQSLAASYEVSLQLARAKKPFSDGILIKKCAVEMAKRFMQPKLAEKFESVALSHQTVARRIEDMGNYISKSLCDRFVDCEYYSICLDESTDQTDISQLIIFIRCISKDFTITEEMLDLIPLHGTTKGSDIFEAVNKTIVEYGGFRKCSCIVTDGAKAMTGTVTGFAGLLKQNGIDCPLFHCIIHQEALCGKSLRQMNAMKVAVRITNLIRGGNRALTHRKFREFLSEIDATYGDLLLHSEIRWLSAGQCLQRFFALRKEIPLFLKNEIPSDTSELQNKMQDPQFLADLAFLTDVTQHLNELNLKLQGKNHNIANLYGHVNGFRSKLKLFKTSLQQNDFSFFPSCKEHYLEMKNFEECNFLDHLNYMDEIIVEFEQRFADFKKFEGDIALFTHPLTIAVESVKIDYQLELCDLQSDPFYKDRTETGIEFFKLLIERFPKLTNFGLKMGSMMGSTYLCESAYSTMKLIKSKYRSSLTDTSLKHALRLATTNIEVDVDRIVKDKLMKK